MPRLLSLPLVLWTLALAGCGGETPQPVPTSPPQTARERTLLTGPWRFRAASDLSGAEAHGFDDSAWERVTTPHTWGEKPFRNAWYRTHLALSEKDRTERIYLCFEGVATVADVYVNGALVGHHQGAFTRFTVDASDKLVAGDNLIAVRASNDPQDTVDSLPSGQGKQLYHLYGGIYRKVWLLKTSPHHIDPLDHAASGVFVTPSEVSEASARLSVKTLIRNQSGAEARYQVVTRLIDREGHELAALKGELTVPSRSWAPLVLETKVKRPHLWSLEDPYLHFVRSELSRDGVLEDAVQERTGFRDFRLENGQFLLNGKPILIRGVGKHQETEYHASAVTDEELKEDFDGLQELGVNMVRLAHYPHAPYEYELADEKGILVWAENGHSNSHKAGEIGETITREMVRQNLNHPSIVVWSAGNETGFLRVNRYAEVIQSEDPTRPVTYASNIGSRGKQRYPNLDFIAHNTYRGWYHLEPWDFEAGALQMRYIAEAGGGEVISNHTDYARPVKLVDRFEPQEYRQRLAEVQFQVVFRDHPQEIPMYLVWIFRDFAIDKYKGVRNTKGLLTYAGFKKDAYHLYRAFLRPQDPVVHLTSKTFFLRRGNEASGVKAYSNRPALTLTANGAGEGTKKNGEYRHENGRAIANVFFWHCRLRRGRNELLVQDDAGHRDSAVVYYDGPGGAPGPAGEEGLIRQVRSTNPHSPATLIDQPVQDQWPFYDEFDGTADNSFDRLPVEVQGARWIATHRLSKPEHRTDLSFVVGPVEVEVFLMATAGGPPPARWLKVGFSDTGVTGVWRDNDLRLVGYRLLRNSCPPGAKVTVPGATWDYLVLVKEKGPSGR